MKLVSHRMTKAQRLDLAVERPGDIGTGDRPTAFGPQSSVFGPAAPFRTYQLSVTFYRQSQALELPRHLRDQLQRAASSVALNLAEGSGKSSIKDQRRYFEMARRSLRECQAILQLAGAEEGAAGRTADALGAHLHKLIQALQRR